MTESLGNELLTLANIREEIILALGGSGVDVELEEADVTKCVKDALRQYNRIRPGRGYMVIPVTETVKRYVVKREGKGIRGIVKVSFVEQTNIVGDPFDPFYYNRMGLTPQGDTFAEFDQKRQYIEQARRVGSVEPDWQQRIEMDDSGVQEVVIYIDVASPYHCSITYTYHYTPDNATLTGMQQIPEGDTDWIINYSTALAMMIVGRKRGKYGGGVVLPGGATAEVDGREMLEEGKTERDKLMEDIKARRRPLLPEIE